jgi:hypothetical protein
MLVVKVLPDAFNQKPLIGTKRNTTFELAVKMRRELSVNVKRKRYVELNARD